MKFNISLFVFVLFNVLQLSSQIVNIPDLNFKNKIIQLGFDLNNDNEIQQSEALQVDTISILSGSITSLVGIEEFTNLRYFSTQMNTIGSVDFSRNTLLEYLDCSYTNIITLDISKNTKLKTLICSFNSKLLSLDLSSNAELENLSMTYTPIKSISLFNNLKIKQLRVYGVQLEQIDLSHNSELERLTLTYTNLSNLDVSSNNKLTYLNCQYNNYLGVVCLNSNQMSLISYNHSNWIKDSETNWSTTCNNGTTEIESLTVNPEIVKVFNFMGGEVSINNLKSGIFIILFSDGTSRRISINK